jgi:hypothetical protein
MDVIISHIHDLILNCFGDLDVYQPARHSLAGDQSLPI